MHSAHARTHLYNPYIYSYCAHLYLQFNKSVMNTVHTVKITFFFSLHCKKRFFQVYKSKSFADEALKWVCIYYIIYTSTCNNHGYFMHIYRKSDTALITPCSSVPFCQKKRIFTVDRFFVVVVVGIGSSGGALAFYSLILDESVFNDRSKNQLFTNVCSCALVYVIASASETERRSEGEYIQTDRSFGFYTALMFKNSNFLWPSLHNWIEMMIMRDSNVATSIPIHRCAPPGSVFPSLFPLLFVHFYSLLLFFVVLLCIRKICELSKQSRQNGGANMIVFVYIYVCVCILYGLNEEF